MRLVWFGNLSECSALESALRGAGIWTGTGAKDRTGGTGPVSCDTDTSTAMVEPRLDTGLDDSAGGPVGAAASTRNGTAGAAAAANSAGVVAVLSGFEVQVAGSACVDAV